MSRSTKFLTIAAIGLCAGASSLAWGGGVVSEVTEEAARATALAAVPSSSIQSAELETEHGRQVWSFDIKRANSTDVVEVQIDAKTGAIVSKKRESAREQKKEAQADQKVKR